MRRGQRQDGNYRRSGKLIEIGLSDSPEKCGVALAAIQGLYEMVQEKDARIADLEARLETLERLVAGRVGQ